MAYRTKNINEIIRDYVEDNITKTFDYNNGITSLIIYNDADTDLFVTVNGIRIRVLANDVFGGIFERFKTFDIEATGDYRITVMGG